MATKTTTPVNDVSTIITTKGVSLARASGRLVNGEEELMGNKARREVFLSHHDSLFFHVLMYGRFSVGHTNRSNSLDQSVDLRPTGSIMLFHSAFAAETNKKKSHESGLNGAV